MIGTTITAFLMEEQRRIPTATGDLTSVINDVVTACKTIAAAMRYGAIREDDVLGTADTSNVQGEVQKRLDVIANRLFVKCTEAGGHVAAMVSEEMEEIHYVTGDEPSGRYLLLYDPVDGSYNVDENASFGTIFSVLRRPDGKSGFPDLGEFLQPGTEQVCAGYAIYGPTCMIVMTTGNGTNGFTLDPLVGEFVLTHPRMSILPESSRLSANIGWMKDFTPALKRYVSDRMNQSGACADLESDLRWSRCAVADVHRVLISGGVVISTANKVLSNRGLSGVLRLLYEVNPLAMLVEQAGGVALNGASRVLEDQPIELHQRSTMVLGSRQVIADYLEHYYHLD